MTTQRECIISDETQELMEATLTDVLHAVANGTLAPAKARGGLLYLIASIDNGEPNQIKTWTESSAPYLK